MIPDFQNEKEKHKYFNKLSDRQKIDAFAQILSDSSKVVFLGGAGVSTESGIPDFRSRDGLYHKKIKKYARYKPEYLLSHECLKNEPEVFFDYYRTYLDAREAEPNDAHFRLAEMELSGRLCGVITQNIDGLHQKAGSKNVQEIHGTIWSSHCDCCGRKYGVDFIFDNEETIPICPNCGRMVRPDVTLYGEFLPEEAFQNAVSMLVSADCLIIGGTSLAVGSAAGLVHSFHGKYLIIINKGKTRLEGRADLVFHDSIGWILNEVCGI